MTIRIKSFGLSHLICMLLVGLIAGSAAYGQQSPGAYQDVRELPEGAIGERITELIEAVNSNDEDMVRALVTEAFTASFRDFAPMDMHLQVFAQTYRRSGGLDFHCIREYQETTEPNEVVVIARERLTDSWAGLILNIEPTPPHRINSLRFAPARPPSDLPKAPKLTDAQIALELEEYLKEMVEADVFSGAVLLAKDGEVFFQGAYGLASKRFDVPNKIDTKFNLGSMNKMFTGVAIAQLVQRGKLSLDDPLSKFVSADWLPREVTDKIKIKHLLTHTSGLGSYFSDQFTESSRTLFRELDDYKPLIAENTLAFEPGTDWRYSNSGMFMLGVVIEKVTGQSYFDYVRENIYEPAGMTDTDCYEMDRPVPNLAIGYSPAEPKYGVSWTNNLFLHSIKGGPAGGGFSTVLDLLKFDQALREHKLLGPEYTELVLSPKPEIGSPGYGFGFRIDGEPGNRIVGHSGGFPGISSNLAMHLDTGYTVAVMSNYDDGIRIVDSKLAALFAQGE